MTKTSGHNFTAAAMRAMLMMTTLAMPAGLALAAEDVSENQIVRALAPNRPLTRSLSGQQADPSAGAAETRLIDSLRNRQIRSLSTGDREQIAAIAAIAKDKPNIDLEINFDYDSADISRTSEPAVRALGKALSDSSLKGSTFLVAGHTDATGGESYNQGLSNRRVKVVNMQNKSAEK